MDNQNQYFSHIISLGFFCSTALELERLGLRDNSMPFDWCISEWNGVERLLKNHFKGFLDYHLLYQNSNNPRIYKNIEYGISFHHDFDKYKSLKMQLMNVQEKYMRRIERFYTNILEPTLFVRYIMNQEELKYLEYNYSFISRFLCQFCPENNIIFIGNSELGNSSLPYYIVEKDENDSVAREPFSQNTLIYEMIENRYDHNKKEQNLNRYNEKMKRESRFIRITCYKLKKAAMKIVFQPYAHINKY